MDAYSIDLTRSSASSHAPVLIVGDTAAAISRASRTVEAAGLRVGATLTLAEAPERLDRQASMAAVWVELEDEVGEPFDRVMERVDPAVAGGR